jgi:hypothetical protein
VLVGSLSRETDSMRKFDFKIYIFTISVIRIATVTGKDGIEIIENMGGFLSK